MQEKDYGKIFGQATKHAESAKFQESLNLLNEVFLFHPEGAIAYKHYFQGLVETNLEDRMRHLERARESFLFLFKSTNENLDKPGMNEVHTTMQDHWKGLEGTRRSTMEEYDHRIEYGSLDLSTIPLGVDKE